MDKKVLLVDDEPHVLKSLTRALSDEPYKILTAASGEKALAILEQNIIDVVVSDEMMPGMTGIELLSLINREFPNTITILLTGHANLELAERAITEGEIFRFLAKPWNDVDLTITIRQAIQLSNLTSAYKNLQYRLKEQTAFLRDLEKKHPGISEVTKDEFGAILIDDVEDVDDILNSFLVEDPD